MLEIVAGVNDFTTNGLLKKCIPLLATLREYVSPYKMGVVHKIVVEDKNWAATIVEVIFDANCDSSL